jgi:hypothetical protein
LQRIKNEIIAFIPIVFNKTNKTFIPPNDSLQLKLLNMLLQKEILECQNRYIKKGHNGNCKFGFPYSAHNEANFF